MQANNDEQYDVRITEAQRRIIAKALANLAACSTNPPQLTNDELEECRETLACLDSSDAPLATVGLNDLTPIF